MNDLISVGGGVSCADLRHLDRAESIAVYIVDSGDGIVLVDPGPSSTRERLKQALAAFGASAGDVRHVLLTHIHLDHAGVTGSLARQNPALRVYVHRRGAPHLADPSRLLSSARRIYGDSMERLWGEFLAVPEDQLVVIDDTAALGIGATKLLAASTPGHAVHHLAYLDENEGLAFTGDVAGEATQHSTPALPLAPPPDIDLEAWRTSLDRIKAWLPQRLLLTHFGPVNDPASHMEEMWQRLCDWAAQVEKSLDASGSDDERASAFAEAEMVRLSSGLSQHQVDHLNRNAIESSWYGLARYLRRRAG